VITESGLPCVFALPCRLISILECFSGLNYITSGAGYQYFIRDMLQPREADVPVLFVVFVVLPVLAYFLLGKWNDAVSKKSRASVLAQHSAEEAFAVETMTCPNVVPPGPSVRAMPHWRLVPSVRHEYHECATCHAPAKTRCSRCKSVRYW
jgi:ubiquitin carboxyl-terminal hydrolase 36/42